MITFILWGWVGLIIGLFVLGVGVVPMGFLASALNSQWDAFLLLGILLVFVIVFRLGGIWFIVKADEAALSA